jgi:hypothetical protein
MGGDSEKLAHVITTLRGLMSGGIRSRTWTGVTDPEGWFGDSAGLTSSLELIEALVDVGGLRLRAQLVIYSVDARGDYSQCVDIKECDSLLVPAGHEDLDRIDEYLCGWALAVEEVLSRVNGDVLVCLLPRDLCRGAGDVVRLKSPRTEDDYRDRFLAPSRLGRYVPAGKRCPLCGVTSTGWGNDDGVETCPECGDAMAYYRGDDAVEQAVAR